jgi:hypothetical protein
VIEFIKAWSLSTKIMVFGIFGVALVGTIIGIVLYYTRTGDRGFMTNDKGKPLKWNKADIPIAILFPDALSSEVVNLLRGCIRELNTKVGKNLYDLGTAVSFLNWNALMESWRKNRNPPGTALFNLRTGELGHGGTTELHWDESGLILGVLIEVDISQKHEAKVYKHELGHGLGLDHDDRSDSIMHESLTERVQLFTDKDIGRLQKEYV